MLYATFLWCHLWRIYWITSRFSIWCFITSAKHIVHTLKPVGIDDQNYFSHEWKKCWRTSEDICNCPFINLYPLTYPSSELGSGWLREKCQSNGRSVCLTAAKCLFMNRFAFYLHFKKLQVESGNSPMELKSLSETRWICQYASCYAVRRTFKFILDTLSHFSGDLTPSDRRIEVKFFLALLSAESCLHLFFLTSSPSI